MVVTHKLITIEQELERCRAGWDALAVRAGRPFCLSAWMLAWWRHREIVDAELRTVIVIDDARIIGVAPYFTSRRGTRSNQYRLLGAMSFFRTGPLAETGREAEVARHVVAALAEADPFPSAIRFEGVDVGCRWAPLLANGWPASSRPLIARGPSVDALTLTLAGRSYEEWFAGKSANFRKQMRTSRRRLEVAGARFRMTASGGDIERDVAALARLHYARWAFRGGSGALDDAAEAMIREAGRQLLAAGHFRLWLLEVRGTPISAQLFSEAGGEVVPLVYGFEPAWGDARPGMQTLLTAIEHGCQRGDRRIDFGPGGEPYKRRLADSNDPLEWRTVVPRVRGQHRVRAGLVGERITFAARARWRRLPLSARVAVRRLAGRPGRP